MENVKIISEVPVIAEVTSKEEFVMEDIDLTVKIRGVVTVRESTLVKHLALYEIKTNFVLIEHLNCPEEEHNHPDYTKALINCLLNCSSKTFKLISEEINHYFEYKFVNNFILPRGFNGNEGASMSDLGMSIDMDNESIINKVWLNPFKEILLAEDDEEI